MKPRFDIPSEDIATSPAGWRKPEPTTPYERGQAATGRTPSQNECYLGFHQFPDEIGIEAYNPVEGHGSFEVFYVGDNEPPTAAIQDEGFYWWPCFPGCLPDGEPSGPFPTAEGAYLDAIGE